MIVEDIDNVLQIAGELFEASNGSFLGILVTDMVALSGGIYEVASQSVSVQVATRIIQDYNLVQGSVISYSNYGITYFLTIVSSNDSLQGWTELFCTVGDVENV